MIKVKTTSVRTVEEMSKMQSCTYCKGKYTVSIANCKLCSKCAADVYSVGHDDTKESLHVRVKGRAPNYDKLTHGTRPDGKKVRIVESFWSFRTVNKKQRRIEEITYK